MTFHPNPDLVLQEQVLDYIMRLSAKSPSLSKRRRSHQGRSL